MDTTTVSLLAADSVLLLHVLFVAFVLVGLILIFIGKHSKWAWVRNRWFRAVHLGAIVIVVLQSWLGAICPLTTLEMALRAKAGAATYTGSFVAHWLERALYFDAAPWVFVVCYTLFGAAVLASWFLVPPRQFSRKD